MFLVNGNRIFFAEISKNTTKISEKFENIFFLIIISFASDASASSVTNKTALEHNFP